MGDNAGYICARSLLGFGPLYKFSPSQLQKITKDYVFEKPNPSSTIYTQPTKTWAAFHSSIQENKKELISQEEELLGVMFYSGATNAKLKIATKMHVELLRHAQLGEIEYQDVPKVSTIANWIKKTSRAIKQSIVLQFLKKTDE
ncbi:7831_t:CDS:2 [Dentiscutata erythropus]|uniref:7831_t:CDS:1 n=1 Tax=Dentiscutata erythropus TaxID=1348616 RepID=A0A9N9DFM2_9GLOM|nr:7831_t:CDS:2 [Dentiscutata erythropus]